MKRILTPCLLAVLTAGCAAYAWRPSVPEGMRTVQVPTFRNASNITETGAVATRQVLREFQREGTFKVLSDGAALEIQGEIVETKGVDDNSNFRAGSRFHGGEVRMTARVSVIDKQNGRVLLDNRMFTGQAPYSAGQDNNTAYRDASARAADDLAQRLVDAVLGIDFQDKVRKEK